MVLRIAAAGQVADDPAPAFAALPALGPSQTELRLADARRAGHHGEGPGQESASQRPVQFVPPKRMSSNGHSSLAKSVAVRRRMPEGIGNVPLWFAHSEHRQVARVRLSRVPVKLPHPECRIMPQNPHDPAILGISSPTNAGCVRRKTGS